MELNAGQQRAATHRDGPLKVLAGPGSGKTLVIVSKVHNLVNNGVPPRSILCMTFTEKAAEEMRSRLYDMDIYDVWVGTMHSLCLDILKENPITTGITENTIVFSERARLAWCIRNIHSMDMDTDVVNLERNIPDICSKMLKAVLLTKRELISYERLQEYIQDAPAGRLAQISKLYRAYDAHKNAHNIIDYEDMISDTIEYLNSRPGMLHKYHQQYSHILVDEFQDNNYAQFLLVKILAQSGNITVVGDDDQSIMGFQGAFNGIFSEFDYVYPDAEHVTLNVNYRCSGNIASLASGLLEADPRRTPKDMHANNKPGEPVHLVAAHDEAAERQFVAKTILESDTPYDNVAILCRTNDACQKFAEVLRAQGIPVTLLNQGDITQNAITAEVLALLTIADSPETSGIQICHILKMRGIYEYNIRAINIQAQRYRRNNPDSPTDGVMISLGEGLHLDQDMLIQEIYQRLQDMAKAARSETLLDTLHSIMMTYTDVYKTNANRNDADAARNRAILNGIYDTAKDYTRHYPHERLADFVRYLGMAGDITHDVDVRSDSVRIMTIHKSKGREFDTVFATGLYDDNIPGKRRTDDFEIPHKLLKGKGRERDPDAAHAQDMRNLLYVAATRAMHMLYLTYPMHAGSSNKERKISSLLNMDDATISYSKYNGHMAPGHTDAELGRIQEEACRAILESRPRAAIAHIVEMAHVLDQDIRSSLDIDTYTIKKRSPKHAAPLVDPKTLTLSVTDIQTYQKCPLQFKYGKILKIPQKPAIHLTKGSAVHAALEWAATEKKAGRRPDICDIVQRVKDALEPSRIMYDDIEYHTTESTIEDIVNNYISWEDKSANTLIDIEKNFHVTIGGIRYSGKIDRIETNPQGMYEIVDYKTGKRKETKKNVPKLPQANIYAYAIQDMYGSLPAKFSLYYVEDESTRTYNITKESLKAGLDIIQECVDDIKQERFEPTAGFHCNFCSYKNICPAAK